MCTVSFIPVGKKFFITSNRDENLLRPPSTPPQYQSYLNCKMVFPKDGQAGGSWISLCDNGNAAVLLNGAFEAHEKKMQYKKSRGLVFLDLMDADSPLKKFLLASLSGIEPFTMILWQQGKLYELRWDASDTKHSISLQNNHAQIWSSATLYNKNIQQKKQECFRGWLASHPQPTLSEILSFHSVGRDSDAHDSMFMNTDRSATVSITTMEIGGGRGKMIHRDFIAGNTCEEELAFL